MRKGARQELAAYAQQIATLRYRTEREIKRKKLVIWSFAHITDLRTRSERDLDE